MGSGHGKAWLSKAVPWLGSQSSPSTRPLEPKLGLPGTHRFLYIHPLLWGCWRMFLWHNVTHTLHGIKSSPAYWPSLALEPRHIRPSCISRPPLPLCMPLLNTHPLPIPSMCSTLPPLWFCKCCSLALNHGLVTWHRTNSYSHLKTQLKCPAFSVHLKQA